jgi:hypothetical protein
MISVAELEAVKLLEEGDQRSWFAVILGKILGGKLLKLLGNLVERPVHLLFP